MPGKAIPTNNIPGNPIPGNENSNLLPNASKDLEIDRVKVIEGLFIMKECLPIDLSSEGQRTYGQTATIEAIKGEEEKESVGRTLDSEILTDDLEALYHGPTVCMQLGRNELESVLGL